MIQILDGGMGRELKRMGAPFQQPEWSALTLMEAPHFVGLAHDAFIQNGAQVITTNSYAVVPFHIGEERFSSQGVALARLAGEIARQSADKALHPSNADQPRRVLVAGSLPPALGSYRPDLFEHAASVRVHQALIEGMDASVDVWLAETQSSIAEVRAAHAALAGNAKPLWISFTLDDEPAPGQTTLRSGEPVHDAVRVALELGARAVLFNCSQPEVMEAAVVQAARVVGDAGAAVDIGVYANAFAPQSKKATANATILDIRADLNPQNYLEWAQSWVRCGATIVGGCCGISPEHIGVLATAFRPATAGSTATVGVAASKAATGSEPRLTSLSHGGGCGCKIAPGVLSEILKTTTAMPLPPELLVGIETADDAAVYQLNETQALIATTDFFMPIVDDPFDFGRIAATNAISDVYAMGGTPIMALALVGMPINVLSTDTIGKILAGGAAVCKAAGIPIAGGHTIDSVEPIYGLVALGLVHPKRVKRNADARVGDCLILGKPLGVGVLSAALKKERLDASGYARMIAVTTQLNTPGPELAALEGVHALTDVTGFGLAGHALEMARGAAVTVEIDWASVPLIEGVAALAERGLVTGASGRNWAAYGDQIEMAPDLPGAARDLLSDPQTSGGLLVSCTTELVSEVLAIFARHGFEAAAQIGVIRAPGATASSPKLRVLNG
jgi:selenide,water dikinase